MVEQEEQKEARKIEIDKDVGYYKEENAGPTMTKLPLENVVDEH